MSAEYVLVDYITGAGFGDIGSESMEVVRKMLLADIGTTIGGANEEGCRELVTFYGKQGGTGEATVLIHGGRLPAQDAAMINAVMSRALDYCDAIAPGAHIGSSIIPVALACTELRGACNGKEFLSALVIGAEVGARFNLSETAYNGLDPTGICVPFAATAVASRLLGLDREQTINAMGIALNRCGGSFQSNIDGTLSVRLNQGWVARDAMLCARLAGSGMTGPKHFLEGSYGYLHLYGKDEFRPADIIDGLGEEARILDMMFKKYPSCGATQGATQGILNILNENNLQAEDIASVTLSLAPYGFRLVGHEFVPGNNPTVDAQFSVRYCIASVLLRGDVKIAHFSRESVCNPEIEKYVSLVTVCADPTLDKRGHTALDMDVVTHGGQVYTYSLDTAPGFPGNPLSVDEHRQRFKDCLDYGGWSNNGKTERLISFIDNLEIAADAGELLSLINA